MAKGKRKPIKKPRGGRQLPGNAESQATEAVTVAWAVMVTMVVACDLTAIGAHLVFLGNPELRSAAVLGELMLFAGATIGVGALVLLPIVHRLRRVPPPRGFSVFAVCAAAAPLVALTARLIR